MCTYNITIQSFQTTECIRERKEKKCIPVTCFHWFISLHAFGFPLDLMFHFVVFIYNGYHDGMNETRSLYDKWLEEGLI